MKHIQTFEGFLSINESKNIDFKNSKNKILVGLKTNLLKDMMDRYEHVIDGDMIHFFDTKVSILVHYLTWKQGIKN